MDYGLLRGQVLARIQDLCGGIWTDYNEHDPGVTLLEILCYAVTDLGYRMSFPMADLLAGEDGTLDTGAQALYIPPRIFPTSPVTADDYRRLLIDRFPSVVNAWLAPFPDPKGVLGLYQVSVLSKAGEEGPKPEDVTAFLETVRNLGEGFAGASVSAPVEITVDASLQIDPRSNPAQLLAAIGSAVQQGLMPAIRFQSLQEARQAGKTTDELFEGPLLLHGFLDPAGLWPPVAASAVQATVAYALSRVPGVRSVGACTVHVPEHAPDGGFTLCPRNQAKTDGTTSNHILFSANLKDATVETANLFASAEDAQASRKGTSEPDPVRSWEASELPAGTWRAPESYQSIQHQFPSCYGLEKDGLSAQAPALRRAQAAQLRAFLMAFEQLLANFLAQTARIGRLFSVREESRTYFAQPLYHVPGFSSVVSGFDADGLQDVPDALSRAWKQFQENPSNPYWQGVQALLETPEVFAHRRNRFLDHLLARFAERPGGASWHTFETSENKRLYLEHYPEISASRAAGLDRGAGPEAVSTLERKINLLLAAGPRRPGQPYTLPHADPETPGYVPYPGKAYFLVEHLLLYPSQAAPPAREAEAAASAGIDASFFSLRISHILTNWTFFPDGSDPVWQEFRSYAQSLITASAPAHVRNDFYWIPAQEMDGFAKLYEAWAKAGFPALRPVSADAGAIRVQNRGPAYALFYWLKMREKTAARDVP
jgi:hypothetical protein